MVYDSYMKTTGVFHIGRLILIFYVTNIIISLMQHNNVPNYSMKSYPWTTCGRRGIKKRYRHAKVKPKNLVV